MKDTHGNIVTEGTGSRSRDGAEDLFLLAEYSVLPTYCDALHLHVIFSLVLFGEFAQFAINSCTWQSKKFN